MNINQLLTRQDLNWNNHKLHKTHLDPLFVAQLRQTITQPCPLNKSQQQILDTLLTYVINTYDVGYNLKLLFGFIGAWKQEQQLPLTKDEHQLLHLIQAENETNRSHPGLHFLQAIDHNRLQVLPLAEHNLPGQLVQYHLTATESAHLLTGQNQPALWTLTALTQQVPGALSLTLPQAFVHQQIPLATELFPELQAPQVSSDSFFQFQALQLIYQLLKTAPLYWQLLVLYVNQSVKGLDHLLLADHYRQTAHYFLHILSHKLSAPTTEKYFLQHSWDWAD